MKKYILLGILFSLLQACDVLNQEPVSMTTEANAWKTESDVTAEINAIYSLTRNAILGNNGAYAHWAYGDFRFGDLCYRQLESYLKNLNLKDEYYAVNNLTNWKKFYTAIVQCNLVLEKASGIHESEFTVYSKQQYLAEAHFLRAFLYFYISRIWGDVPLQTQAISQAKLPRSSMDSVLNLCIRDCKQSISGLPWKYKYDESKVKAVKATRGAAYTLLSEIYMWKQNYKDALKASKAVMDSLDFADYRLMPLENTQDNDKLFKGRTNEGIFEIDLSTEYDELTRNNLANITLCWPPYVKQNSYFQTTYMNIDTLNSLYPENNPDRRRSLWFDLSNSDGNEVMPMLLKFKNKSSKSTSSIAYYEDNIILFRLAGLYLLRAEALAHTGDTQGAITLLNAVRERAGATLYDSNEGHLETVIINERRKELVGEGHIWFDMLRNNRLLQYKGDIYNETILRDGAWTWPVNLQSFISNPLLQQTTFWI